MSKFTKSARSWLGIGNDPYDDVEYGDPGVDDYDDAVEADLEYDEVPTTSQTSARARPNASRRGGTSPVRSLHAQIQPGDADEPDGGVRVITSAPGGAEPEGVRGVVRPIPRPAQPIVVIPRTFNDVQEIADTFKRSQPVIANLQDVDRDLSRRLIDFCSGLCYGLEGNMERVTNHVFLLTPSGAEVSDDDRRRIREGGLTDDAS